MIFCQSDVRKAGAVILARRWSAQSAGLDLGRRSQSDRYSFRTGALHRGVRLRGHAIWEKGDGRETAAEFRCAKEGRINLGH
jgi:hypothetical protein